MDLSGSESGDQSEAFEDGALTLYQKHPPPASFASNSAHSVETRAEEAFVHDKKKGKGQLDDIGTSAQLRRTRQSAGKWIHRVEEGQSDREVRLGVVCSLLVRRCIEADGHEREDIQ